jgi:lysine-N-methylase
MKGSKMIEAQPVRPQHGSRFQCVGSKCEDTCCHGWGVVVDRGIYEQYLGFTDGSLRAITTQYVTINPAPASDALYARIELTETHNCPFLEADKLCAVQKKQGPELLSATCSVFPRVLNKVEDELEVSLYLSCPEAARKVLLNPDLLGGDVATDSGGYRTDQFSRLPRVGGTGIHKPYGYLAEVRGFIITLIQDRSYPLWQRVALLGSLCERLEEITTPEQDAMVAELVRDYRQVLAEGRLRGLMKGWPKQTSVQLNTVLRLVDERVRAGGTGERFLECFRDFLAGIGYTQESTLGNDVQRYIEAREQYFEPFFAERPHILENYLLNYVFRTLFPFGREASAHYTPQTVFGEFVLLAGQFVMVRGLLIGMAGWYKEEFNEADVVKLVQSFSKAVEHSPPLLHEISESIRARGLRSVAGIAALVR